MLKQYIIERNIPGVGNSSEADFQKISEESSQVMKNLGPDIQWKESFVTNDKVYCVYLAKDENIIREHARLDGIPADKISEIKTVLGPEAGKFQEPWTQGSVSDSSPEQFL